MPIPKIIHQTCKDPAGLSPALAAFVDEIIGLHPGWEHRLYGDEECRAAVERIFPALLPFYDASAPIQRADMFRIVAVYGDGGFYIDTDVRCKYPLDDLCEFRAVFGEELSLSPEDTAKRGLKTGLRLGNYIFGSEPGHRFLLRILEAMAVRTGRVIECEEDVVESTGPGLVTDVYLEHMEQLRDVVVIPNTDKFCQICRTLSCGFGNYASHAHVGSWRWENPKITKNTGVKPSPAAPAPPGASDALRIDIARRKAAESPDPDREVLLLDIYHENPPFDGLSTVFGRMAAVMNKESDTSKTSGKKVLMCYMPAQNEEKLSAGNMNVIFTTFETTRLPSWWTPWINGYYGRCIVPHTYVREVFLASGVTVPIDVAHQGFTRHSRPARPAKRTREGIFRIGFNGVPYRRKNLFKILQACVDLSKDIPGLRLAVHSSAMFSDVMSREIQIVANAPFVEWTQGTWDLDAMAKWYAGLSCYIFPSSGEGWSFTPRESLYLGVPTIITDIPVHDELVGSGYYKAVPVSGMEEAVVGGEKCGEWHSISVRDIKDAIADVYFNYGQHLMSALRGAEWIENRWTNESSQQRVLEIMRSL